MSIEWWIILLHDRVVKGRRHSRLTSFVQEVARFYFLDDNWLFFRHSPSIRIVTGKQSSNLVARVKFAHVLLSSCWGNFHSFTPHGERSLPFFWVIPMKKQVFQRAAGVESVVPVGTRCLPRGLDMFIVVKRRRENVCLPLHWDLLLLSTCALHLTIIIRRLSSNTLRESKKSYENYLDTSLYSWFMIINKNGLSVI